VLVAAGASNVGAAAGPSGYDGKIPFDCELQQAGQGTEFPHPDADPFCVEYDKTHQNLSQLGVVEFLSKEPARVAAAGPKCWYFQRDHWVGSIVQDDGSTQTYKWDGSYFFDKARGVGGVFVENFTVNGQTGDPRDLPGFPEDWKPYFGPGKGGVQTSDTVRAQSNCVAKAKQAPPPPGPYKCSDQRGAVGAGIGPLRLGAAREEIERELGPPARTTRSVARWCTADGGKLVGAFRSDRLAFALTTSPGFSARGATPGNGSSKERRTVRKLIQRRGVAVLAARSRSRTLLIGVDRKRVRFLAVAGPKVSKAAIGRWLDASR
jgi:hypothetical protein